MYMYITAGTYRFLKKIEENHPSEKMLLLQNMRTTELWHETEKRSVFQSPRKYDCIDSLGELAKVGYVACHYVPVRDENKPLFEYNFDDKLALLKGETGLLAARILRPLSSDVYIIMTMWESEKNYVRWQGSPTFQKFQVHQHLGDVFSSAPHTYTFTVAEEEVEEEQDQ
ncbi:antibiotic biosynthesis monooxygenase [Lederbergia sp. NSJ-179]|uniref:antibiotic biosynthesis monooxygenase family protein n=1 Tax=Lederbergia sp. NSJ-179 TaxID=2931402 RepID=UPI001FD1A330|nr:antibiotic biosynthesis monooxygenase family protein [Lederbergia sp. NSJ-179]MCJ7840411.1 antibiotic biosynthesis monooxygenase [Lederbergia sp. NSJ-179]